MTFSINDLQQSKPSSSGNNSKTHCPKKVTGTVCQIEFISNSANLSAVCSTLKLFEKPWTVPIQKFLAHTFFEETILVKVVCIGRGGMCNQRSTLSNAVKLVVLLTQLGAELTTEVGMSYAVM